MKSGIVPFHISIGSHIMNLSWSIMMEGRWAVARITVYYRACRLAPRPRHPTMYRVPHRLQSCSFQWLITCSSIIHAMFMWTRKASMNNRLGLAPSCSPALGCLRKSERRGGERIDPECCLKLNTSQLISHPTLTSLYIFTVQFKEGFLLYMFLF